MADSIRLEGAMAVALSTEGTMRLAVVLRLDIARQVCAKVIGRTPEMEALFRVLDASGVNLKPVHPGQTHELLVPYFYVEVPDEATGALLARRLLEIPIVESAYVKPDDALP